MLPHLFGVGGLSDADLSAIIVAHQFLERRDFSPEMARIFRHKAANDALLEIRAKDVEEINDYLEGTRPRVFLQWGINPDS